MKVGQLPWENADIYWLLNKILYNLTKLKKIHCFLIRLKRFIKDFVYFWEIFVL